MKENVCCLRSNVAVVLSDVDDSFIPSLKLNPDKHQHNYLITARLILKKVPY